MPLSGVVYLATVVLDLEIERLPAVLAGFDRYDAALALIRFRGTPRAQIRVPVVGGCIDVDQLRERANSELGAAVRLERLRSILEWSDHRASCDTLPTATVAVCTRDRPRDLQRCLAALMRLVDDGQEVLVIDNCPSTAASREVVDGFPGVRYVYEKRPGLDRARNRALREATGEIVAFCDDDAAPDPNWLHALLTNFDDPLVMCVTGLTMPIELETEAQEWFEHHSPFGRGFKRLVFDSAKLNAERIAAVGAGANMALRRAALTEVGAFDEALDAGTPTRSGGDTDYFLRILAAGYRIVYEPASLSWHRHRTSWPELRRVMFGYGAGIHAAWARQLLVDRELSVANAGLRWLQYAQVPALVRSALRRKGSVPLDVLIAELAGCAVGPLAYFWTILSARVDRLVAP